MPVGAYGINTRFDPRSCEGATGNGTSGVYGWRTFRSALP